MENDKKFSRPVMTFSSPKEISELEREMLKAEFEVMQKCDFIFIREIGASSAEEYITKITSLEFLREENADSEN